MAIGAPVFTEICHWNRGVPLYTEVSSLQGVGMEKFHCIRTEVSSLQGVGIEGFHCIQRCPQCWNRGVPLYTEVSSLQSVGMERFHCIQRRCHFRELCLFQAVVQRCPRCMEARRLLQKYMSSFQGAGIEGHFGCYAALMAASLSAWEYISFS